MFQIFSILVSHHLAILDVLTQQVFWVIPKVTIGNLCNSVHEIIIILLSSSSWNLKVGQEGEKF